MAKPSSERPRLRPLEAFPVEHEGERLLALRDPSGLAEAIATLPPAAVAVVQLCDGTATRDEICAEFERRYRQRLPREALDALLEQLDEALLLDSDRFREHALRVRAEFDRAEVRAASLAGRSYPDDPAALRAMLDGFFDPPRGPGRPDGERSASRPRALVAPHIDFHRGGPAYAWAYRPLADAAGAPPELVVVFGTDHNGVDQPFTLTRKHYDTPLGRLETDVALVEHLARVAGGAALFADEHHHRGEHSIEFQAVWLRYIYGERASGIRVLPVLCGSLHGFVGGGGDPRDGVGGFLGALRRAVDGRDVLWIAGADLAHVGPRFGDDEPLDGEACAALEAADQATLGPLCRGDAEGWFDAIRAEEDRRRVCGLSPIYALLDAARPTDGRVAAYGQCPAEEGSIVSIASIVF